MSSQAEWGQAQLRGEGESQRVEFPSRLSGWRTRLASMRTWVRSLALLSGLGIRCCHELWCGPQIRLRSCVVVTMGMAGSCSSNSTSSLGTSICCGCGPKETKRPKKKKKKKKEKKRRRSLFTTDLVLQDPRCPHTWGSTIGCVSSGKHSVSFQASAALQSSSPPSSGTSAQPDSLLPPGAPVFIVPIPTRMVLSFPQRALVHLLILQMRKLRLREGKDSSRGDGEQNDSGSRLRLRLCPLCSLPGTGAHRVLGSHLGRSLT